MVADLDAGVFFVLAVSSLSVIGVLMAGWASANKYSLIGGIRAAGQLIAYELPMVLAVVGVVILAGTLNLNGIVIAQATATIFGLDSSASRSSSRSSSGFLIFLAAVQAELTQTPFDMPVAESELVAGYQVEYSGFRFLIFFLGRVRHGLRLRRHRRHAVPRWLVPARGIDLDSNAYWRARARRPVRQGDAGLVPHLLVPLHLSPLP